MQKSEVCVLHDYGILNRGGAETLVMNLYRLIDRRKVQFGFVVHLDTPGDYDGEVERLGGTIFYAPRYRGSNHFAYVTWWKKFFENHPEYRIVHSHIRSTASIVLAIAQRCGRKIIAHSHSVSNGSGVRAVAKGLLQLNIVKHADDLFACSDAAGRWLFGRAANGENYFVFKNAIDISAFAYNHDARMKLREEFGQQASFVMGTVGRITMAKNPYGIIRTIQGVCRQIPEARFLWVGTGELESEVKQYITNIGIADKVIFAGNRSDVPALLSAMDVFLFPSLWEGLGMAAIEAQASGLPCLVSDRLPPEINITSLVQRIAPEDTQGWVDAVLAIKENRHRVDTIQAMQTAGYDISESAKWLQDFYWNHC